jgi:hypothetical protein
MALAFAALLAGAVSGWSSAAQAQAPVTLLEFLNQLRHEMNDQLDHVEELANLADDVGRNQDNPSLDGFSPNDWTARYNELAKEASRKHYRIDFDKLPYPVSYDLACSTRAQTLDHLNQDLQQIRVVENDLSEWDDQVADQIHRVEEARLVYVRIIQPLAVQQSFVSEAHSGDAAGVALAVEKTIGAAADLRNALTKQAAEIETEKRVWVRVEVSVATGIDSYAHADCQDDHAQHPGAMAAPLATSCNAKGCETSGPPASNRPSDITGVGTHSDKLPDNLH